MTKQRLIEEVKTAGGELGSNAAAERAIDAVVNAIQRVTGAGDKVIVRGFGTFERRMRNQRTGRNPRTGEAIIVPSREALVFKESRK